MTVVDLDKWDEESKKCKILSEEELKKLCEYVSEIMVEEANIINVSTPVTVCGDVHGQFHDVEKLFETAGQLPDTKYIFLGDFVDRGAFSIETWTRLMVLKAKYPDRIYLLRGNHESRQITQNYGFYDECMSKYGNAHPWKMCCQIFDLLAIGALIDHQILCIHGGLSPYLKTIDKMRIIRRNMEIPNRGGFCDLVWSDPENVSGWEISPRGAGWLFGENVTRQFCHVNGLSLICRAHQLVNEGFKFMFDNKLVTIWSAPNYCYRCGNVAAVIDFQTPTIYKPKVFEAVPIPENLDDQYLRQYFL